MYTEQGTVEPIEATTPDPTSFDTGGESPYPGEWELWLDLGGES